MERFVAGKVSCSATLTMLLLAGEKLSSELAITLLFVRVENAVLIDGLAIEC